MRIGEVAQRSGLTVSRIRFYERVGLLGAAERRPNGYRTYTSDAVQTLELIATAQNAGFSLDEIRALLPLDLGRWDHDALVATLRRKLGEIKGLEARLAQVKERLTAVLHDVESKPDDLDCAANARRVLVRMLEREK